MAGLQSNSINACSAPNAADLEELGASDVSFSSPSMESSAQSGCGMKWLDKSKTAFLGNSSGYKLSNIMVLTSSPNGSSSSLKDESMVCFYFVACLVIVLAVRVRRRMRS